MRDQVEISTDNRSIFYRVCDVGDWGIYRIPEYADDAIRTAILLPIHYGKYRSQMKKLAIGGIPVYLHCTIVCTIL